MFLGSLDFSFSPFSDETISEATSNAESPATRQENSQEEGRPAEERKEKRRPRVTKFIHHSMRKLVDPSF